MNQLKRKTVFNKHTVYTGTENSSLNCVAKQRFEVSIMSEMVQKPRQIECLLAKCLKLLKTYRNEVATRKNTPVTNARGQTDI